MEFNVIKFLILIIASTAVFLISDDQFVKYLMGFVAAGALLFMIMAFAMSGKKY